MFFVESGLSILGFSIPIITELLILIDYGIYSIAFAALSGFFKVLEMSYQIFGSSGEFETISLIIKRAMGLAGIFALFKVSLTLISYAISPDTVSKANQSGRKIITNVVVAVVLLLTSTFIFKKLGEFQELVFESKVIEKIVYGDNYEESKSFQSTAKQYTNVIWLQFFTPKKDVKENTNDMSSCISSYNDVSMGKGEIISLIGCHYKYFDYIPIAPFITGILLIYYFVTYSLELCVRLVKLLVLEIIYPIPVIMSIDPNDKNNRLQKYATVYFGVYFQVFLRVITLYLAFVVLNLITNSVLFNKDFGLSTGTLLLNGDWFLKIVLIIGVFKGMKELPKLIEDAIGLKLGTGPGNFTGALKGIIGGTTGFIGGTVAGAISGGVGGAVAGGLRGAYSGAKDGAASQNIGGIIKSTVANYGKSRNLGRSIRNADGLLGYAGGMINSRTGYKGRVDRAVDDAQRRQERLDKLNNAIMSEYAQSINPSTGRKVGTMEEDAGVMAAQVALNDYMAGKSGAITQAGLDTLRNNLKTAQDTYKEAAYKNFVSSKASDTGNGLEFFDSGGKKINPKSNYTDLSESQRALYDLQRFKQTGGLDVSSGNNMYTTFTAESKKVKQEVKERQKKQGSLSYQHVEEVNKNGK